MKKKLMMSIFLFLLVACAPVAPDVQPSDQVTLPVGSGQSEEFRTVADLPYVDSQYLLGKELLVTGVVNDDVVFEDLSNGNVFKISIYSAPVYKGFEHNSFGLTEESDDFLQIGYLGVVEWNEAKDWQVLYNKEKTFEKVFGSPQDLGFQEAWYGFVNDVNDYYSETNIDPTYSTYYGLNFSEDFTPSEACRLAESFSVQVKIDSDYSFCQISDAVWYRDVASAILFAKQFGDKIDLNAVYPNPGDNPSVLAVGEKYQEVTFLGCFSLTEGSFEYDGQLFGDIDESKVSSFVNPVRVVFATEDYKNSIILPFKAEIAYEQFDASKRKLFSLPPECDFRSK